MGAIQDALKKYGDDTVTIIRGNMSSTGTNASGETSQSLRSEQTGNKVEVSGKAFIYVVETGRGPGGFPPVSNLVKWIQSKGVSIDGRIESAAFAMAKTIAEKGSRLWRTGGRDDIITPALSDQRLDALTSEIADIELGKTVIAIEDGIAGN